MNADRITSDVIAPSMWTIIGCRNGKNMKLFYFTSNFFLEKAKTFTTGLRFFKEAKAVDFPTKVSIIFRSAASRNRHDHEFLSELIMNSTFQDWDDQPAIMAVGVVDASPEAIFQTVMSLGQSRSE